MKRRRKREHDESTRWKATLSQRGKRVNQARLVQLYRSLVQSRLLYGAEVVTESAMVVEKLDRVQTSALRIVTGCTRDTARTTLQYMADLKPVPQQIETLRVTAVAHLETCLDNCLETPAHPLCT